jgi:MazG family protein
MNALIKIMERLRAPSGCPWDRKQTFESLTSCLLEESYEVIDAVLQKKKGAVAEELGDLLCIISMMIVIAEESGLFDKKDVVDGAVKKMIHRHPHVFGTDRARTSESAHALWHAAKEKEKGVRERASVLDDLNDHCPALHRADKIGRRVARVGFDWPDMSSALDKVEEEMREVKDELKAKKPNHAALTEEIGDLLFSTANVARKLQINPEIALRKTNIKFIRRFQKVEARLKKKGLSVEECSLEEMDAVWEDIKARRKKKKRTS